MIGASMALACTLDQAAAIAIAAYAHGPSTSKKKRNAASNGHAAT